MLVEAIDTTATELSFSLWVPVLAAAAARLSSVSSSPCLHVLWTSFSSRGTATEAVSLGCTHGLLAAAAAAVDTRMYYTPIALCKHARG